MAAGQDPDVASHGSTLCCGKIAELLGVFLTIKIFLSLIRFNWCNYRFWFCWVGFFVFFREKHVLSWFGGSLFQPASNQVGTVEKAYACLCHVIVA